MGNTSLFSLTKEAQQNFHITKFLHPSRNLFRALKGWCVWFLLDRVAYENDKQRGFGWRGLQESHLKPKACFTRINFLQLIAGTRGRSSKSNSLSSGCRDWATGSVAQCRAACDKVVATILYIMPLSKGQFCFPFLARIAGRHPSSRVR